MSISVLTLPSLLFYVLCSDLCQVRREYVALVDMKYRCGSENMQVSIKECCMIQDSVCILFSQHEHKISSFRLWSLWADKDNTEEPVAFIFTFVLHMEAAG